MSQSHNSFLEGFAHQRSYFLQHHTPDSITEANAREVPALEAHMVEFEPHCCSLTPMEKKRENRGESCFTAVQPKDTEKIESRGQKKLKADEPPVGYIHVRARRGQATDSHSLAERVRRERISERMKLLQALVPGCNKVVGKALVLEEIINYVQSLQNQVEFLSMKLAFLNSMSYDVGGNQLENLGNLSQDSQLVPSLQQTSPFHVRDYQVARRGYTIMDPLEQFLLHGSLPEFSQDSSNSLMQVSQERHGFLNKSSSTTGGIG